jgi:hypothetical protein
MNQAEITAAAKRLMGQPYSRTIDDDDITTATADASRILGEILARAEIEYFITRKSLQSDNGFRFAIPSDSHSILRVWDMGTNAIAVTGAADNGAGLVRITATAHGFATDDTVTIHDIVGTTEGNGTWKVTYVSANTFDLQDSTYASAYTSGGYAFKENNPDFTLIRRQTNEQATAEAETMYYLEGAYIVVDDTEFENDILVTYYIIPTALASIPTRFHFGIPGFCAMTLIELPTQDDRQFASLQMKQKIARELWRTCIDLAKGFRPITESKNISESTKVRRWI